MVPPERRSRKGGNPAAVLKQSEVLWTFMKTLSRKGGNPAAVLKRLKIPAEVLEPVRPQRG